MDEHQLARQLGRWADAGGPLYRALAGALRGLVERGELPPGDRLPAERRLAETLDVSRGTVVGAYDLLRADDVIRSRRGSGTVVAGAPLRSERPIGRSGLSNVLAAGVLGVDLGPSAIDLRVAAWIGGADIPRPVLDDANRRLARLPDGHGCWPAGLPELREAVAARLTATGLPTDPDEVVVTTGAQQAVHLVAQLVLRPGDTVAVEEVSYLGALDVFAAAGARLAPMPLGRRGPDVSGLGGATAVYVMPSLHNPTGIVTDVATRKRLLHGAAAAGAVVVDDQAVVDTWFGAALPPPLAALAADDPTRVLTVGSLSKIVWGGLRVGWVRGARSSIDRLTRAKGLTDLGSSVPSQLVAASVLRDLDAFVARRLPEIRRRRDVMVDELHRHLPEWRFDAPDGGLALWVDIGTDAEAFAAVAAGHGVGVLPGLASSADGSHRTHLRIGYGLPPERIVEGVRRLAAAWSGGLQAVV